MDFFLLCQRLKIVNGDVEVEVLKSVVFDVEEFMEEDEKV